MSTEETDILHTNIFCLIGKPGAGRSTILKNVLNRDKFIEECNISKFVYGTTRPKKPYDIEGETYHFMSKDQFLNLDPDEVIESRSYDPFFEDEEYYYFTLKSYIKHGYNYIGKTSVFQYDELKKWTKIEQLKSPLIQIKIYPIIVNASIFEREKRMIYKCATDSDIYTMCVKFISERYEFNTVAQSNPEIIDKMNPNTLILSNNKSELGNIPLLGNEIEEFIKRKIAMQGL